MIIASKAFAWEPLNSIVVVIIVNASVTIVSLVGPGAEL